MWLLFLFICCNELQDYLSVYQITETRFPRSECQFLFVFSYFWFLKKVEHPKKNFKKNDQLMRLCFVTLLLRLCRSCSRDPTQAVLGRVKALGLTFKEHYTKSTEDTTGSHIGRHGYAKQHDKLFSFSLHSHNFFCHSFLVFSFSANSFKVVFFFLYLSHAEGGSSPIFLTIVLANHHGSQLLF